MRIKLDAFWRRLRVQKQLVQLLTASNRSSNDGPRTARENVWVKQGSSIYAPVAANSECVLDYCIERAFQPDGGSRRLGSPTREKAF